jgi:[histone H3]-lysine36 N-dimethyltransferase SETMAR
LNKWVPHELSEIKKRERVRISSELKARAISSDLLGRFVTGDEKWVFVKNVSRSKHWALSGSPLTTQVRQGSHGKRVMLSVWWCIRGVIHFELLPENETITSTYYCKQLEKLQRALIEKRSNFTANGSIAFHQDNARQHVSRNTIESYGWERVPHSPDIAPSDFYLFRSLSSFLKNKQFESNDQLELELWLFFNSKDSNFYKEGIYRLLDH